MYSTRYSCAILTKLEFSRQIFEKYSNTKINENPSNGRRVVQCANTQGEANTRFSQLCERTLKLLQNLLLFIAYCLGRHTRLSEMLG